MFDSSQYQLIDFGSGEKLETFGGVVVRRQTPSVSTDGSLHRPQRTDLAFRTRSGTLDRGTWQGQPPVSWQVRHTRKNFWLKPTPAGQVGLFPEQHHNWEWIEGTGLQLAGKKALNLFGYTGGTTMSLASQGAAITHIDAASNVVKWARKNAESSNLIDAPIRWIAEDALKFVNREVKRGSKYDILVADPPTYGRGPNNETWKFEEHISPLLEGLSRLASPKLSMLILSCHTPEFDQTDLLNLIQPYFDLTAGTTEAFALELMTPDRRVLGCGHCVRFK